MYLMVNKVLFRKSATASPTKRQDRIGATKSLNIYNHSLRKNKRMSSYSAQELEHLIMEPYIVQAEFSFKGSNNDELCFKKGDVITVTQREEGGWWEGTLNDTTGWFPSNYVKEYKASLPLSETIRPPEEIQESREIVLNELLESEKAHVAEIRGLLENFLEPLQTSQILNLDEYAQLMCNFTEIVDTHEELFRTISECEDRVGKLFLTMAPHMKKVHQSYCAAHPRAIVILDKYRDELELFMERQGAATPGLLVLTTGLSKPFRRLDKYSAMLQELERHMESGHPDRGDTQRSVAIYKDIAASCAATRRQKELELQVLTGPVRGWQGEELSTLGDIMHMGSVAVGPDHRDRYFVLFPQTLLILSVSQRMSAFIYEGKLPVAGIIVNRLEDSDQIKNAFEISGPLIEKIVAVCQGPTEANRWVEFLKGSNPLKDGRRATGIELKRNVSTSAVNIPQPPPHMSPPSLGSSHPTRGIAPIMQMSQHKRSLSFNHHLTYNQMKQHQVIQPIVMSKDITNQPVPNVKNVNTKANWSITNLRPAPPLRPSLLNSSSASNLNLSNSKRLQPTYEEDALVLKVIEAYCAAYQNNSRNTIHSALQPWTPCLPIRGGKLKSSKHFSSSNPQLPFLCASPNSYLRNQNNSSNSLNSSFIWREASPNNFNMYSTSVSSLNNSSYRYSVGGGSGLVEWRYNSNNTNNTNSDENHNKSLSKNNSKPSNSYKTSSTASNYDNVYIANNSNSTSCVTPLLARKKFNSPQPKVWRSSSNQSSPISNNLKRLNDQQKSSTPPPSKPPPILYDRRLNRSFEAPQGIGGGSGNANIKTNPLRRSTPHLTIGDDYYQTNSRNSSTSSWCCGNFMMKQWRKVHNCE